MHGIGDLYHARQRSRSSSAGRRFRASRWPKRCRAASRLRAELLALMDAHGLDVWLAPAAPGPAPAGLDSTGDPGDEFALDA